MAEVTKYSMDSEIGCGFISLFQRTKNRSNALKVPGHVHSSNQPRSSSSESPFLRPSNSATPPPKPDKKPSSRSPSVPPRHSISQDKNHISKRPSDAAARSSTSSSIDHHQSNDNKYLVRATSGNIMLFGHLGNLRHQVGVGNIANNSPSATIKTADYLHNNLPEMSSVPWPKYGHRRLGSSGVMGNIIRQPSDEFGHIKGLMNCVDPDVLKAVGNEAYKRERFEEALSLYDRAISVDPNKASYHSNKSAALIGLGRLLDAVFECKEAVRLDPSYDRAHHRLATIYIRVGEVEKAMYHFKRSGNYTTSRDIAQAQDLQEHLDRCTEAQKLKKWDTLLVETRTAISSGADSAPQVYSLQAAALLKLQRYPDAYAAYQKKPNFSIESCCRVFGLESSAYILMVGAQVYLAAGRFEDAAAAAQHAAQLDPNNKEISAVAKRMRGVGSARLTGNLLYKASKFSEACIVYSEGLEQEPHNSVLLCNRAACRSKLGQFEKAVEDCNAALVVQPSYSKARLRRAHCNAKLERWEVAIQDYEMLLREAPGDEEVGRALFEAQVQLKKLRGEDIEDKKFGSNLVIISSNERFRHFVTSPGMSVVLFCNKSNHQKVVQLMEQVCKRFPSVNFLKVEVEEHPYLAKSEGVSSIPAFKIYKNGSRVKEIPGNNGQLLESSLKLYTTLL